jgi:hypothetical protein
LISPFEHVNMHAGTTDSPTAQCRIAHSSL